MLKMRNLVLAGIAIGALTLAAACGSDGPTAQGSGLIRLQLTDAPFPFDSVQRVDVYVLRIDAKLAETDDDAADTDTDEQSSTKDGWITLAEPDATFDLLTLRDGTTANLGQASIASGTYRGFRLIIDPSKSSLTLKGGLVLDGGSTPGVSFPSAARSGIKINLNEPVTITEGTTTTLVIDFDVGQSFVMRGNSLSKNGLLFKPVIRATVK